MKDSTSMASNWLVYILLCSDNSLYTGITTDMSRRFRQHAQGKGAKYFRGRQPLRVVYSEEGHNRSSASQREARIKAMTRGEKDLLISQDLHTSAGSSAMPSCRQSAWSTE